MTVIAASGCGGQAGGGGRRLRGRRFAAAISSRLVPARGGRARLVLLWRAVTRFARGGHGSRAASRVGAPGGGAGQVADVSPPAAPVEPELSPPELSEPELSAPELSELSEPPSLSSEKVELSSPVLVSAEPAASSAGR
jgi:hypothetical protein